MPLASHRRSSSEGFYPEESLTLRRFWKKLVKFFFKWKHSDVLDLSTGLLPSFPLLPTRRLPSCSFLSLSAAPSKTVSVWFSFCFPSSLLSLKEEGPKHRGMGWTITEAVGGRYEHDHTGSHQIRSLVMLLLSLYLSVWSLLFPAVSFRLQGLKQRDSGGGFFSPLSGSYLTQFALNCCPSLFFVYLLPQLPQPRLRYTNTVSSS